MTFLFQAFLATSRVQLGALAYSRFFSHSLSESTNSPLMIQAKGVPASEEAIVNLPPSGKTDRQNHAEVDHCLCSHAITMPAPSIFHLSILY